MRLPLISRTEHDRALADLRSMSRQELQASLSAVSRMEGELQSMREEMRHQQRRHFHDVAKLTRLNRELHQRSRSLLAEEIGRADRAKLRDIGRYLVRNHPAAQRAVTYVANRVVGQGIFPEFQERDPRVNARLNSLYNEWVLECDVYKEDTLQDLQILWIREIIAAGEALTAWTVMDGEFLLMPFESEQLADWTGTAGAIVQHGENEYITGGIAYDRNHRRVRYYLEQYDPFGMTIPQGLMEIPAGQVYHLYMRQRPSQRRGISSFDSTAQSLWDISDADFSELQLIKLCSYFGLYEKLDAGDQSGGITAADGEDNEDTESTVATQDVWEPGMMRSGTGDVKVLDLNRPSGEYQSFRRALMQLAAARLNVPYSALSGDTTQANYASRRGDEMDARPDYQRMQRKIIDRGLVKATRDWLTWEILRGRARIDPNRTPAAVARAAAYPLPVQDWIDPDAETKAMEGKLKNGVWTFSDACAANGKDPIEQREKLATEIKEFQARGLKHPYEALSGGTLPAPPAAETSGANGEEASVEEEAPEQV